MNCEHITPYYPESNGIAERDIQTITNIIKKTEPRNLEVAILSWRKTPIDANTPSPYHILFHQSYSQNSRHYANICSKQEMTINKFKSSRRKNEEIQLKPNDQVYIRHPIHHTWDKAEILNRRTEPHSYDVITPLGNTYRRARHHIRPLLPITPINPINYNINNMPIIHNTNPSPPYTGNVTLERDLGTGTRPPEQITTDTSEPLRWSTRIRRPPQRYSPC